jgi:hypothetical protein
LQPQNGTHESGVLDSLDEGEGEEAEPYDGQEEEQQRMASAKQEADLRHAKANADVRLGASSVRPHALVASTFRPHTNTVAPATVATVATVATEVHVDFGDMKGGAGRAGVSGCGAYDIISGDPNAPSQESMCSESEYEARKTNGEGAFSEMERDPMTKEVKWPQLVVCRYQFHRGGAGASHMGANMRTLAAMQATITHLETVWMTEEMISRSPGGYAGVYKVLHDALKAISADMAFLRRHYAVSLVVANVFERIIRIALDAHYRVAEDLAVDNARPAQWAEDWVQTHGIPNQMRKMEGIGMSRSAQGGTAMGSHEDYIYKNLNTLVKDVYPELKGTGTHIANEPEFVAYFILKLSMRGGHQKDEQDLIHLLSSEVRRAPEVQSAMYLREAIEMDNYVAFFRGIHRTLGATGFRYKHFGYLLCALAHEHFPHMRRTALDIVTTSRKKNDLLPPLESVYHLLGCDDAAHCAEYLISKGLQVTGTECLLVKTGETTNNLELCDVRKVKIISAKMPRVPGHVCGGVVSVPREEQLAENDVQQAAKDAVRMLTYADVCDV